MKQLVDYVIAQGKNPVNAVEYRETQVPEGQVFFGQLRGYQEAVFYRLGVVLYCLWAKSGFNGEIVSPWQVHVVRGETVRVQPVSAKLEIDVQQRVPLKNLTPMQRIDTHYNRLGVLIKGEVQQKYAATLHHAEDAFTVVAENGTGYTYSTEEGLLSTWEPFKA